MSDKMTTERMQEWMDDHSDYLNHTPYNKQTRKAIRARLSEFDVLKAEMERIQCDRDEWEKAAQMWNKANQRLQAKLAAARPLLEAVEAPLDPANLIMWADRIDRTAFDFKHPIARILRAALAYRAKKEGK